MTVQERDDRSELDRRVRHRIYRCFVETGRAPTVDDLAIELCRPGTAIEDSLQRLAADHLIVLAPGSNRVWMAHPFSAVPTPYPVRTARRRYWANCAWDALAIPALLGEDTETTTHCADCAEPLTLRVRAGRVEPSDAVVHFAVAPARFWENVGFT